ncbi:NACHT domain-containing protein [Streptomyces sp. NPDC001530]|uniref:NACHT domain-containing protein n=1 Tax=Streptomyces sp. NPDC001530 TaxID=3364582 RepID=UPI00368466ED
MDPTVLGTRLASSLIAPLVRKLFLREPAEAGAGLVDKPVRLSSLVSFRGEKRNLTEKDVHHLAARLVRAAVESPGEPPFPPDEETAVTDALARTLLALGELGMDNVQAVRLGHTELARQLRQHAPAPAGLSTDAALFLESVTEWACVHILDFFTQRSTFVARTLVEQTRGQSELIAKVDELITRNPRQDARYSAFERRYLQYIAERHSDVTIYGIDLRDCPDRWPLEVAYLSLEATATEPVPDGFGEAPAHTTVQLPAEHAFDRGHDRVLLRGDAGSGKTTLIQWLAVTAARAGDRIPFVLPLRTLVRADALPDPEHFLSAVGCPLPAPEFWAERVLSKARRGLVLVDGLDEIPTADRHRTRDWLTALIRAYPGNRWLLTSRPTAVRPNWLASEGFCELLLTPMGRADVSTFVRRWHTAAAAPDLEAPLLDALHTKPDLGRLATNPLMCGLICALHRERRGYLPTGRKELYDSALSMLLARRDRERGMGASDGIELGEEAQLELLQRLAYALTLSGRTEMEQSAAQGLLERNLPTVATAAGQGDATAVFRHLLLRSGLLRQPAEGVVDFVHRTFQDYLGARYAIEEGHIDVLASKADDPQWEDVIRMAIAHARSKERAHLLEQLLAHDTPRLTLLALACLEHATALDPVVRAKVEARASALIPPRTKQAAQELAEAGPLVLELLPAPEGLTDDEALGVAVTASMLATDGSLAVLKRFRDHPSLEVRRHLVGAWHRFDLAEYASEVLAHLDPGDLSMRATQPAQLRALDRIGVPWADLLLRGAYEATRLLRVTGPGTTTHLTLQRNPLLTDLSPLLTLESLRYLQLDDCPGITDLSPLADSHLTELHLRQLFRAPGLPGLGSLRTLRSLGIGQPLQSGTLTDALPSQAPLEQLFLSGGATRTTGLRGLSGWSSLQTLGLGSILPEPTAADWAEVSALPALDTLVLHRTLLPQTAAMPTLPTVRTLRVTGMDGTESLTELASRLPGVTSVSLQIRTHYTKADYGRLFPDAEVLLDRR